MIPRSKTIFTIEGECGGGLRKGSTGRPSRSGDLVGLRIIIQCPARDSNVVAKSSLRPCKGGEELMITSPPSLPQLSSLKECFSCRKRLSLKKEVYMYRGNQGFCSVECRSRRMLEDERKEFEALARERQRQRRLRPADHRVRRPGGRAPILVVA